MCGIVLVISKNPTPPEILKKMNDSLIHRGPDGEGFFIDSQIAMSHRRLSIVDLSNAGAQPMHYMNRYIIVFNGEIYNYIELRDELIQLGYKFQSKTDTEVIMASFAQWGKDCIKRFNGMWAFAIYDREDQKVFISRDRFGIKPLYYYKDENILVFSSEIKAILKHNLIKKEYNEDYCRDFLELGAREYIRETAFKSIFRFTKGSFAIIDTKNFSDFQELKYWKLDISKTVEQYNENKAREYASQYFEILNDAVKLRLRSDVKVGSALSGGLDSSSIVYLINNELQKNLVTDLQETFSSIYKSVETNECDESEFIDEITKILKVNSNRIEPDEKHILSEHRKFVYYLDTPADNSLMSSWYTYKLTSKCGVKVTLDGQGADEQLGGYLKYITDFLGELPPWKACILAKAYRDIPKAKPYIDLGVVLSLFSFLPFKSLLTKLSKKVKRHYHNKKNLNERLKEDLEKNLETLFHYADRGSMAFSIESRMPFMDYRLVQFLASVPSCYKLSQGWTKYLARMAFNGKLPNAITWRRDKMGWPIPEKHWFQNLYAKEVLEILKSSKILLKFKKKEIESLTLERIQKMSKEILMRYYSLAVWYEVFFEDPQDLYHYR